MASTNAVTYFVENMRVTKPGAKTQERNPERVYTVTGTFYATVEGKDGKLTRGDKMTVPSKNIDNTDVLSDVFAIDLKNGILTLPTGKRGKPASEALSEDAILAEIAALRNPTPAPESTESK